MSNFVENNTTEQGGQPEQTQQIQEIYDGTIVSFSRVYTPHHWEYFFSLAYPEIQHASNLVLVKQQTHIVYPAIHEIFTAFNLTAPHNVKVVILGQDPYPNVILGTNIPTAHGLSFSTRKGAPIPRSLQTIFKEIERTYPSATFANGDLTQWANQGVLMLNSCLTVNKEVPGSHEGIWNPFIKKVIDYVCYCNPKTIFVLWGKPAQKLGTAIIPSGKTTLMAGHPSPLNRKKDFMGCNHFVQINEILTQNGDHPIDWSIYETI